MLTLLFKLPIIFGYLFALLVRIIKGVLRRE